MIETKLAAGMKVTTSDGHIRGQWDGQKENFADSERLASAEKRGNARSRLTRWINKRKWWGTKIGGWEREGEEDSMQQKGKQNKQDSERRIDDRKRKGRKRLSLSRG
jgi:hypothetical protein